MLFVDVTIDKIIISDTKIIKSHCKFNNHIKKSFTLFLLHYILLNCSHLQISTAVPSSFALSMLLCIYLIVYTSSLYLHLWQVIVLQYVVYNMFFTMSTWWRALYSVNMMMCPLQCYIVLYSVDVGLFQRQCQLVSSCGAGRSHDGAPQQRRSIHLQCSSRH